MKTRRWIVRILGAWVVLFLMFDAGVKVLNTTVAIDATTRLGYPAHLVPVIGWIELLAVILYVVPATSVAGALLLTGFLGGAAATQVRVEDPWFALPIVVGAMVWGPLWLNDSRVRRLLFDAAPPLPTEPVAAVQGTRAAAEPQPPRRHAAIREAPLR